MTRLRALVVALAVITPAPGHAYQRPGVIELVSVTSSGAQGNAESGHRGNGGFEQVAMTPDGRYVAFASAATNLVAGDTNGAVDMFVHDRVTRRTERVSVASDGRQGTSSPVCQGPIGAGSPAISSDGRYVAFESCFPDLVLGDVNVLSDVFVHDRKTHATTLVSVLPGALPAAGPSTTPSISADGRLLSFQHTVLGVQRQVQVYVRDTVARTTRMVSVAGDGTPADGDSFNASLSPDGRYVAFTSHATNLAGPGCLGVPSCADVFLHELANDRNELVSVALDGGGGDLQSGAYSAPRISADNRYVTFQSEATNLVPNNSGGSPFRQSGVFVRDRQRQRTTKVTVDSYGTVSGVAATAAAISADGRHVVYRLMAPTCTEQAHNWFGVHDRVTGATEYGPTDVHGRLHPCADEATGEGPQISADGRRVAFTANFPDLVARDTNKHYDVFVLDRGTTLGAVVRSSTSSGTQLVGASVAQRPQTGDLFVRLEVARMPLFALASPAVVYGVDLTVTGVRYQVRAAKVGLSASFGLFRLGAAGWAQVAVLQGGYGTTGQEVVVSVPLDLVGGAGTVSAFAGLGSYATGVTRVLDHLTLERP